MKEILLPTAAIIIMLTALKVLEKIVKESKSNNKSKEPEDFKGVYKKIDIMTRNEYAQYRKMLPIVQKLGLTIFTKVRLADLIEPTSDGKQYMSDFGRIKSNIVIS